MLFLIKNEYLQDLDLTWSIYDGQVQIDLEFWWTISGSFATVHNVGL